MNIVYLSPNFPPSNYLFCVQLKHFGRQNVLGIGDAPFDELRTELREAITEYYRVDSLENYDQVLRACGYFTHVYGKIDRIFSNNEHWAATEARLRTDFNVTGLKLTPMTKISRKSEMKKLFQGANVPVPKGRVLKNIESALKLAEETGYPLMLKPDRCVRVPGTYCILDEERLRAFFDNLPPIRYIAEAFVDGDVYSYDGLTDQDGVIVFNSAHRYSKDLVEAISDDSDIFYYSLREISEDLDLLGRKTIRAADLRESFFHIEFIRDREGNLFGVKIMDRPAIGLTTDMFNFAHNIDIYREWANVVVHNRFEAEVKRPYHCGYIGRKINKPYVHSHREIMQKFGHLVVWHTMMPEIFSAAIGHFAYLVNCETVDEFMEVVEFVQKYA